MSVDQERKYWEAAADDPDVEKKYISSIDTQECLAAIIPHLKHHRILEIGCGIGRLTSELCMSSKMGCCNFHGIDISEKMIGLARENTQQKPDVRYKVCDGRTIPDFACCAEFDSVYSILTFQHIPDEAKAAYIKEAARVLKTGGIFRVQFVEGDHQSEIDHNTTTANMESWFTDYGFGITSIEKGLICPEWTWITGVKA